MLRLLAFCIALMAGGGAVWAHLASDSYLRIDIGEDGLVAGSWDIALRDLDVAVGLDADANGEITWGELRAKKREIEDYAFSRLTIARAGGSCRLRPTDLMVDRHAGSAYAVLPFGVECPSAGGPLTIGYRLLFDIDPTHRGLLTVAAGGTLKTEILTPEHASVSIDLTGDLAGPNLVAEAVRFVLFGYDHILHGYDHLLFVAVLLVAAPFDRQAGRSAALRASWMPIEGLGRVVVETLKILTAFTVAHAITLTLAVLGVIDLPSRLVDPAVALTIVLAAIDNIWSILPRLRWQIAFGFGLIHGLAFASALGPMNLSPIRLALGLAGFNVGVELGQLTLAALLIPIAFSLRGERIYRRFAIPGISLGALLLAAAWFVDRVGGLDLLGFGLGS